MSPPVHPETPRVALACRCRLGEEAVWDTRSDTLTWVDIEEPAIWRFRPGSGEHTRHAVDEKIGFAILTPDPDVVIAGFQSGVVRLQISDGSREPIVRPEPYPPNARLNSGTIGPDGALYFGSMDDAEEDPTGSFHRWDGQHLSSFGGKAAVTNGPVVSPDGTCLYTIDTSAGIIRVHTLDDGQVGEPEPLITFESGWGKPDGLTLDAEGHLWVCHYGGSRITRFTPAGAIERLLPVPTPLVTKCAFGGPDLSTLYITTALRDRDPTLDPLAGHLFMVEMGIRGLPGAVYEGAQATA